MEGSYFSYFYYHRSQFLSPIWNPESIKFTVQRIKILIVELKTSHSFVKPPSSKVNEGVKRTWNKSDRRMSENLCRESSLLLK